METLREGSRGADVQLLQSALTRAGYSPGAADGIFGARTKAALINYQNSNGLPPTGIADERTWDSLIKYIQGYTTVKVKPGDTFYSIAANNKSSVRQITTANPEAEANSLKIGQTLIVPYAFPVVITNIQYTSYLNDFMINGLKARYPFLKSSVIGKSAMGKNIQSLSIGNGATQVGYNAAHHANEWITTPVLLKYLEDYSYMYSTGGRVYNTKASELFSMATLHVVPMLNPDGVDLVAGVLKSGTNYQKALAISKKYPSIPFPSGWKANINGVDLNLQYPAGWEKAKEIKYAQGFTSPAPRDFVGSAPLSESESRAMHNFTLNHDFALILAYHTQGEIIYWKYANYEPPNSRRIANMMGDASGYTVEQTPYASGNAGYKDWFIEHYNRPGYTIEVGRGSNPLPISQFDSIYAKNLGILTIGITEA